LRWIGADGRGVGFGIQPTLTLSSSERTTGVSSVQIKVRLRDYQEDWEVTSELFVETGQLDALARDVRRFVDSLLAT
jgi:hypothetical protein